VYKSLLAQTVRDFEWVVVDDGSDDGTDMLVAAWERAGEMRIAYLRKENAGKHVAVNRGVEIARGEFTTIIDSDDWFVPHALETLLHSWGTIPLDKQDGFSGVVGLCAYEDGRIVGDVFPHDPQPRPSLRMCTRLVETSTAFCKRTSFVGSRFQRSR
jgi:glycosyltransferase involved in cell wall biosynthesis